MRSALRVALVGAGHIAGAHLAGWRRAPGARVVAAVDLDRAAAERLARRHRISEAHDDLGAVLERVDVVDVCTPPASHAALAEQVLAAGRHLLIEKPLVTRVEEWERLRRVLADSPGRVAVVHNLKFGLAAATARRWIAAGRIGEPLRLHRQFLVDPRSDRMLSAAGHWSRGLPGGRWFETLPHELYLIHDLLGALEVDHVHAVPAAGDDPGGAGTAEVRIGLAGGGRMATIEYSARCRLNRRLLELTGSDGVILLDVLSDAASLVTAGDARWRRALGRHRLEAARDLLRWLPDRGRYLAARLRGVTPHVRLIGAFARHLRGEGPAPTPLAEIDYVIRQSERIGRAIDDALREDRGDPRWPPSTS